jgi:hypothetical protein
MFVRTSGRNSGRKNSEESVEEYPRRENVHKSQERGDWTMLKMI